MRTLAAKVFPWPEPAERRAAVAEAARIRQRSEADRAHARLLGDQLLRLAHDNHVADAIARNLRGE